MSPRLLIAVFVFAGAASCVAAADRVHCSSREFRDNYCPADTRGGVRLLRQTSRTDCDQGRTWGYDRRGIWVSGGCEGEFELGAQRRRDAGGRPRRSSEHIVVCESRDFRYQHCDTPGGRSARLVRQLSKTECRYGRTWGHERGGVWVDRGCGAEFSARQ